MANTSNTSREKDAKDAARDAGDKAAAGAQDLREELDRLREDVARLTQEFTAILSTSGNMAWRKARSNVEGVLSEAQDKGMEAVEAVREVGDNMIDAVDESLKKRPYTTLLLAVGLGFLFGATWRR